MDNDQPEKESRPVGDILNEFVKKNRLQGGLDQLHIEEIWKRELGPAVRKYTTGIKLQRGVLYVHLSSSVLREELGYGKTKIITLLNEELGKKLIEKLVLR